MKTKFTKTPKVEVSQDTLDAHGKNDMKMVQGGKCGSCGNSVGMITSEKQLEQDCDKGFGTCGCCEEQILIHEERIWDAWRKTVRESLKPKNQKEWDKIGIDIQKAFILDQLDKGNLKIEPPK